MKPPSDKSFVRFGHLRRAVGRVNAKRDGTGQTLVVCRWPVVSARRVRRSSLLAPSAGRLADLGRSTLTLVVTVGNPAQRVYERLGFSVTSESGRIETADRPD